MSAGRTLQKCIPTFEVSEDIGQMPHGDTCVSDHGELDIVLHPMDDQFPGQSARCEALADSLFFIVLLLNPLANPLSEFLLLAQFRASLLPAPFPFALPFGTRVR